MFEWKKKDLLNKEVKFFGGTVKGFISCYAKQVKPRIKINLKPESSISDRLAWFGRGALGDIGSSIAQQQAAHGAAMANIARQGYGLGGGDGSILFGIGSAGGAQQAREAMLGVFGR